MVIGLIALQAEPAARNAAAKDELMRAIRELRVVTFGYEGHARTVEPHACDVDRSAEAVLYSYHTAGESASGAVPGRRTYALDKVTALAETDTRFTGARAGYAADHPKLDLVWTELPAAGQAKTSAPSVSP